MQNGGSANMLFFLLSTQGEPPFFIAPELQAADPTWLNNTFAASTLGHLAVTDGTALRPRDCCCSP